MGEMPSNPENLGSRFEKRARVGLFGAFGCGNIGNDASMDAFLTYLAGRPELAVDVMCAGPADIADRYGVATAPMIWNSSPTSGVGASALKVLGKGIDAWRIMAWVRGHDAVIIPGMGVFEASLPVPPWAEPLRLFLVSLAGRLFGTKVGYVSVGADVVDQQLTRRLFTQAARLATYRSCRDSQSRTALETWGIDAEKIPVYPDLAFALPVPPPEPGDPRLVCVGVMEYKGGHDDHDRATIRADYVKYMTTFVRWLLTEGRDVRLLIGDTNGSDQTVVEDIITGIRQSLPRLDEERLTAQPVISLADVLAAMAPAGTVVAARFHNVVAALMLGKPTLAIGYGAKHDALMADWGAAEFCLPIKTLDDQRLTRQFAELLDQAPRLRQEFSQRKAASELLLKEQFDAVADTLFA